MATDRISVLVKFPRELLADIDWMRGQAPRMGWIVSTCAAAIREGKDTPRRFADGHAAEINAGVAQTVREAGVPSAATKLEKQARRTAAPITGRQLAESLGVSIGPVRQTPGARLKK